jgi:hypothetical protein
LLSRKNWLVFRPKSLVKAISKIEAFGTHLVLHINIMVQVIHFPWRWLIHKCWS